VKPQGLRHKLLVAVPGNFQWIFTLLRD